VALASSSDAEAAGDVARRAISPHLRGSDCIAGLWRMTEWLRWTAPPAIVLSLASPVYAEQYLTVEQAQKLAFPSAKQFVWSPVVYRPDQVAAIEELSGEKVMSRGEQVWKAQSDNQFLGFFLVDYVIGKHLVIDYAVALDLNGSVKQVEILEYRESYGGEVANPDWLAQFKGKTVHDPLDMERSIRNISGATLSSHHVTEGIKRVLAIYEVCLK
jgi:Na+-translocating ferredoxin:NAD+ oxidoreductase RnfG subunit